MTENYFDGGGGAASTGTSYTQLVGHKRPASEDASNPPKRQALDHSIPVSSANLSALAAEIIEMILRQLQVDMRFHYAINICEFDKC